MPISWRIGCLPLNRGSGGLEQTFCFQCCPGCINGCSNDCDVLDYFDSHVEIQCDECGERIESYSITEYYEGLEKT